MSAVAGFARRFRRRPITLVAAVLLGLLIAAALAAPLIEAAMGVDAEAVDLSKRMAPPSWAHPLGNDELGRDQLIRLLYGGRVSLLVGVVAAVLAMVIGGTIGILAGYLGGWVDAALMRLTDGVISLPLLPLMIVLAAADPTKLGLDAFAIDSGDLSVWKIILVVALFGWTTVARLARAATFTVREMDYVAAARGLGTSNRMILLRHIAPNIASPIVVATALSVGQIILAESALSFLGVGIQPPTPSWGAMLTNAQALIWSAPWLAIWPGVFIFLTVIGFNLVADGLQDALDPRS